MEANDRALEAYGYTPAEFKGLTAIELRAPQERGSFLKVEECLQAEGQAVYEELHQRKDGSIFPVELSLRPVRVGGSRCFLAIARDITERKQAEAVLQETEARYRNLVDSAFDGYIIHQDGLVKAANAAYAAMYGYTIEELIGKPVLGLSPPEVREEVAKNIRAARITPYESIGLRKNNTMMPIETVGQACSFQDRSARIAAVRDITERKRAEEEKAKLEAQLLQAQKMETVGRLAGGVAHDFNNMLGVILGHAELAIEQVDPAQPLHDDLMEIRKAANRSADLTRQLLAFARRQTIMPKVLDLNETVAGMLDMLKRLVGEDIDLDWQPGADLWPIRVDPSQIDQILANLCVNARDAISGVGTMTIETRNSTLDQSESPPAERVASGSLPEGGND